ncbi:MAG: 4'-phosphopantetheinyl transferase superfamily protein [Deltaproteobacteria bacterium]
MKLPNDIIALSIDEVWTARERLVSALTAREAADFAALRYLKRRRDWLAGRMAAKRALQRHTGLSFTQLEIRAEAEGPTSGRPVAWIGARPVGCLSISHSADLAMATWSEAQVGVDAEVVEPRDESFLSLAFTRDERRHIEAAADRDLSATTLWCEKEAYAKYLGVGFRRSFSDLEVPTVLRREAGSIVHRGRTMCWARVGSAA